MDAGLEPGGRWPHLGGNELTGGGWRQPARSDIGAAVIARVPAPTEGAVAADAAPAQIDGSAPLWARRQFLQRSRRSRAEWIVGAAIAIVVVWLVAAAVVGLRP